MKEAFRKYLSVPLLTSALLIITPLVFTSVLSVYFIRNEQYFSSFSTLEWLGFSLAGIFTQALALSPPTFLALVMGYFWGWKTLPVIFGINMASIFLVNKVVKMLDHQRFVGYINSNARAQSLMESIKGEELKIIAFAKLSPVLPFTFTNFIFTLSGAKLKNILLGGFLGMIPRTIMSVWAGTQAKEIRNLLENPNEGSVQKFVIMALILISFIGLFWVIGRAVKKNSPSKNIDGE